jgi:hypothetical protein
VTSSHDLSIARVLTGRVSRHVTGVYNPKAFIPHAASLRQAFAHCGRFSTAASRRSLGSVSVPVWPVNLSARLPVIALVGRYPTNKLIGHRPLREREARRSPLYPAGDASNRDHPVLVAVSSGYPGLSGKYAYALLTLSPLDSGAEAPALARLACLIHAASVRSEPGSNPSFCASRFFRPLLGAATSMRRLAIRGAERRNRNCHLVEEQGLAGRHRRAPQVARPTLVGRRAKKLSEGHRLRKSALGRFCTLVGRVSDGLALEPELACATQLSCCACLTRDDIEDLAPKTPCSSRRTSFRACA